jgi:hypothetical protein
MELPLRNADVRLGAAYVHWLRGHVRQNTPLDRMVRDILLGNGAVTAVGPANFYTRATEHDDIAARTAESFLGIRLQCMMCHAHFTANYKGEDWQGFAAFFSQVKQKYATFGKLTIANVVMDMKNERLDRYTLKPITPRFPDGTTPSLKPLQDRREVLADWLTSPKNPYFARTLVNYIWRGLVGKGFTDAPERLHEVPFTANDAVLDALAKEMVASRFDGKQLIRIIMNSRVYQLAPQANDFNKQDDRFFSRGYPRRVQSEVFNDMLTQLLEDVDEFDKMPPGTKAIHLLQPSFHLSTFSRPQRISACECEKTREANLASILHELNSERIQRRLKARNRIDRLIAEKKTDREMLEDIILTAFSRMPTNDYFKTALEHVSKAPSRRQGWEDVLWAVMNTREFLFRP